MSFDRFVIQGDALDVLRSLPDGYAQCCITSPPYFGLRDYGEDGQIGLEEDPSEYVEKLVAVFAEVRRVLRADGTLWLNLGDSYAANRTYQVPSTKGGRKHSPAQSVGGLGSKVPQGMKPKDLLGIPWMVAFALRADGWYLRQDIIWHKPNPMPSSVRDRCTTAHEYVFMLSKKPRYYYDQDAIREEPKYGKKGKTSEGAWPTDIAGRIGADGAQHLHCHPAGANKRDVWTVATQPFPDAHFAVFPPKLIEPMMLAGSSSLACGICGAPSKRVVERTKMEWRESPTREDALESYPGDSANGRTSLRGTMTSAPSSRTVGWEPTCNHGDSSTSSIVLDPFCGSGTTGVVAAQNGRRFLGIDLSPKFCEMAYGRIREAEAQQKELVRASRPKLA